MRRLVDAQALARAYALPASWWYRKARANEVPHLRLPGGRYVRFDAERIEAWLNELEIEPQKGMDP